MDLNIGHALVTRSLGSSTWVRWKETALCATPMAPSTKVNGETINVKVWSVDFLIKNGLKRSKAL